MSMDHYKQFIQSVVKSYNSGSKSFGDRAAVLQKARGDADYCISEDVGEVLLTAVSEILEEHDEEIRNLKKENAQQLGGMLTDLFKTIRELGSDNKIQIIKRYREVSFLGLREAKETVDLAYEHLGIPLGGAQDHHRIQDTEEVAKLKERVRYLELMQDTYKSRAQYAEEKLDTSVPYFMDSEVTWLTETALSKGMNLREYLWLARSWILEKAGVSHCRRCGEQRQLHAKLYCEECLKLS